MRDARELSDRALDRLVALVRSHDAAGVADGVAALIGLVGPLVTDLFDDDLHKVLSAIAARAAEGEPSEAMVERVVRLADAARQAGDSDTARSLLARAEERATAIADPDGGGASLLDVAVAHLRMGDSDAAAAVADTALTRAALARPGFNALYRVRAALILYDAGAHDRFGEALDDDLGASRRAEACVHLAERRAGAGRAAEALALLDRALRPARWSAPGANC